MREETRQKLERLIRIVEGELARVDEACGERPKYDSFKPLEPYSKKYDAWLKKRELALEESKLRLADEGARFRERPPDDHHMTLAGVSSSCTSGWDGLFRNWQNAARRRIAKEAARG